MSDKKLSKQEIGKELGKAYVKAETGLDLDELNEQSKKYTGKSLEELSEYVPGGSGVKIPGQKKEEGKSGEGKTEKSSGSFSNSDIFKVGTVVLKSGVAVAIGVILLCMVMSIVTMYTSITGTVVQIVDGTIYDYGEPKDEDKNKNKEKGEVQFNGDVLYTKLKMIVQAVEADNSLASKVDALRLPSGVPSDLTTSIKGQRKGNYRIIQLGYLMKELSLNEYSEKFDVGDGTTIKLDWRAPLGSFYQENSCGASMDADFPSIANGGWLSAHKISYFSGDGAHGPFQMKASYFTKENYKIFVPSLEKDNGSEYGLVCKPEDITKDKMKYNASIRLKHDSSSMDSYQFSDLLASVPTAIRWNQGGSITKWWTKMATDGGADLEACQPLFSIALYEMVHRGGAFWTESCSYSSKDVTKILAELAADGLLVEDEFLKRMPKLNSGDLWMPYQSAFIKENGLLAEADKDNKCSTGINCVSVGSKRGLGFDDKLKGDYVPRDLFTSPLYKICIALRCGQEIEALADLAFDELGLVLPSSGKKMELKETSGEFQGFWSDKNGKTLSSDEMKTYKSSGDFSGQPASKNVGLRENSGRMTVNYINDPFSEKFGDNKGVIWYHQSGGSSWGTFRSNRNATNSIPANYCGGYSTAIALSTLLHRYINPPEVIFASNSYDERHGTSIESRFWSGSGLFTSAGQKALISEQKYNNKPLFTVDGSDEFQKDKVDSTLDSGGLVIACFSQPIASGGGHFVVIRSRDSSGNYYLADPSHNNNRDGKKVNEKFTWSFLSEKSRNQATYIKPGPGYSSYLSDYMSSSSGSGVENAGDYKYWVQSTESVGQHGNIKCVCPKELSAGCFVYSAIKICKLLGAEFDATQLLNKCIRDGIIAPNGACLDNPGLVNATGLNNYTMESIVFGDINYSTSKGKKELATKIYEYQKDGKYVFVRIGTETNKHHFVNMFSSDGENIEVWDSGTWRSQGSWEKFISHYKSKGDVWASEFRVIKKK